MASGVRRGYWVGLILYSDNKDMCDLFDYLCWDAKLSMVWVDHRGFEPIKTLECSDFPFESVSSLPDPVKPHRHIMIKYRYQITPQGALKSFYGVVKHVEMISNPVEMVRYFMHQDFPSLRAGKEPYQLTDLHWTDTHLKNSLIGCQTSESDASYMMQVLEIGKDCSCFSQLTQQLILHGYYDAAKWCTNHTGTVRGWFPWYPWSLADVGRLQKAQNGSNII